MQFHSSWYYLFQIFDRASSFEFDTDVVESFTSPKVLSIPEIKDGNRKKRVSVKGTVVSVTILSYIICNLHCIDRIKQVYSYTIILYTFKNFNESSIVFGIYLLPGSYNKGLSTPQIYMHIENSDIINDKGKERIV